jgi:uncharacterized membrane protein YagU involved in acid resistance
MEGSGSVSVFPGRTSTVGGHVRRDLPMHTTTDARSTISKGAVAGMGASGGMAMVAMVASATYQHHGFFTPLFHISALIGSPDSMMSSMTEAMAGNRFWFTPGAALVGVLIHMMTGAMFGVVFAVVARRVPASLRLPAGAAYGLVVFAMSAVVGLPVAAKVTGSGSTISDMASMVGWATFAAEHLVFGAILGALAMRSARVTGEPAVSAAAPSAMLSR